MSIIIDWAKVNDIIYKVLDYFSKGRPAEVSRFLNWYEQKVGSTEDIRSPEMRKWIVQGISEMKRLVILIQNEIKLVNKQIDQIATSNATVYNKMQATQNYRQGLINLRELLIEFLGCRYQLTTWYVSILETLAINFPRDEALANNVAFFQDACSEARRGLL